MKESILALLLGIGGTKDLGEKSPSYALGARIESRDFRIEAVWDSADKIESPGWSANGTLAWKYQTFIFGGMFSYRHTEAWDKDATWLLLGLNSHHVEFLLSHAVVSQNNEFKIEVRAKAWKLELHSYYELFQMTNNPNDHRFGLGSQLVLVLR